MRRSVLAWKNSLHRYWQSFSFVGLIVAALFFAASLSPSLLPRVYVVQGLLSGIALAIGYGIGVFGVWIWQSLECREPTGKVQTVFEWLAVIGTGITSSIFLWRATIWQNSIRELMEMEPLKTSYPWRVAVIAVLFGALLIAAVRTFWICCQYVQNKLDRLLPPRVSHAVSFLIVAWLLILIINGVLVRGALTAADAAFVRIDAMVDEEVPQPMDALASGSSESLIAWRSIGRQGKEFIVGGPSQQQISDFAGKEALRPLRVYVGLGSRSTAKQRAELALEELKRVNGFDRSILIVATPTGTGWLDNGAVDTVEYLHGGDTAIVSMAYSYQPSWITILVDPDRSRTSALALFHEIYGYWKTLPRDDRPKLYLHGLSLGSLGSETCADLFTLFEDPIQGAVWSGPPFPSTNWASVTSDRNPGSPQWLPKFRDGTMLRFTARKNAIDQAGNHWGPMRLVYVQHASDPMSFFSPELIFRRPDWLEGDRGPDVSPYLSWYPIITFLQIACDLPMATNVPSGYGHNISVGSYIDAWVAVTDPPNWSDTDTARLKREFAKQTP